MNKTTKFLIFNFILTSFFLLLIIPILSSAEDTRLVTCTHDCDFNELMDEVNRVIQFILFYMAIPIAAIMFGYAGFLMIISGGEAAGARNKAKSIFANAVWGLIFIAASWLIIRFVLQILGYNGAWIGF